MIFLPMTGPAPLTHINAGSDTPAALASMTNLPSGATSDGSDLVTYRRSNNFLNPALVVSTIAQLVFVPPTSTASTVTGNLFDGAFMD